MILNKSMNSVTTIIWGLINKFVLVLLPFLIRSVIIKELGVEYLGLNGLFASILSVLNISELGISTAITYSMYKPIAENDTETINALLNLYRRAYRVICLIVIILGIGIAPFISYFIKDTSGIDINIYILYGLYLINDICGYTFFSYKMSLFSAHQRNDVIYKTHTLSSLVQYTLQFFFLCF